MVQPGWLRSRAGHHRVHSCGHDHDSAVHSPDTPRPGPGCVDLPRFLHPDSGPDDQRRVVRRCRTTRAWRRRRDHRRNRDHRLGADRGSSAATDHHESGRAHSPPGRSSRRGGRHRASTESLARSSPCRSWPSSTRSCARCGRRARMRRPIEGKPPTPDCADPERPRNRAAISWGGLTSTAGRREER